VLVLLILVLGAVNLLAVRAALRQGGAAPRWWPLARGWFASGRVQRTFFTVVGIESVIGVLLLGVVGLLVNQPPAQSTAANVPVAGLRLTARAQGDTVVLSVNPGSIGLNHFDATVTARGKPPPEGTNLVLRLTFQDADLGTSELPLTAQGGGHFAGDSSDLSTYGRWQITALIQPPAADEVRTDFTLALSQGAVNGAGQAASGDSSVQRGRTLFAANCARCHGSSGHGDGPDGKGLDPPPVDLVVHVPQHSDQQLLGWIANGIPATAMPSFGAKLEPVEQQAILNYLRTLSPATPSPAAGR
jgi:mono/diheme cytochrome c family protein